MRDGLRNGAALVTGGAQRLGAAMVRALAERGFAVAIHCHASREAADALAAELRAGGAEAAVVTADLLDRTATAALVPAAAAALGRPLSVLVNNGTLQTQGDAIADSDVRWLVAHYLGMASFVAGAAAGLA